MSSELPDLPEGAERDYPMERLTTVRAGGHADVFARVGEVEALIGILAYARDADLAVGVVGSGSNLLVSDAGFRGFAMKLEGDLATIERDYPLGRLTTVRAGGPADFFARPESEKRVAELLAWAAEDGLPVGVVGSGSNLLVSDEGFRGLVVKLAGELTAIERDGAHVVCGGGARLPSAAAQAARWGLAGLEFGINIPGTVGGAVRMNANAYGGELGRVLEWVSVSSAGGSERRAPESLGFAYRRSNLGPGEIVTRASFQLSEGDPAEIKGTLASMRERRRQAQPSGIKTFGSTFVNPEGDARTAGQLLDEAGCRGLQVGGARLSDKHANFVENAGDATTADILALMSEARRRVHDRFGIVLEPEVQVLGEVEWPAGWKGFGGSGTNLSGGELQGSDSRRPAPDSDA